MKTAISTILGGFLCLAAAAAPEFDTAAAVTASAPGAAFLQGEQLAFRWTQPERSPGKWQLRDWRNRLIRQGDFVCLSSGFCTTGNGSRARVHW